MLTVLMGIYAGLVLFGCLLIFTLPDKQETLGDAFGVRVKPRGTIRFIHGLIYSILVILMIISISFLYAG